MNFKILALVLTAGIGTLTGCANPLEGETLTEQTMQKYLSTLGSLKDNHPELLRKLGTVQLHESGPNKDIAKAALEAGFDDYEEFAAINGKVLSIYYSVQRDSGEELDRIRRLHQQDREHLEALLANPAVPPEVKSDLRGRKSSMEKAYRDTMEHLREQTGHDSFTTADAKSVAVVKRHEDELYRLVGTARAGGDPAALKELKQKFRQSFSQQERVAPMRRHGEVVLDARPPDDAKAKR
jgi:hypothetical protein